MKKYDVKCEVFGFKIEQQVLAESEENAKEVFRNQINFCKVEESIDTYNQAINALIRAVKVLQALKPEND